MKNKINTIIAVAVALGVVWLWNEGLFNMEQSAPSTTGTSINPEAINPQTGYKYDDGTGQMNNGADSGVPNGTL